MILIASVFTGAITIDPVLITLAVSTSTQGITIAFHAKAGVHRPMNIPDIVMSMKRRSVRMRKYYMNLCGMQEI